MSMSNITAPVPGEKPGFGSTAGPNPYVPGGGNGFLIPIDTLLGVTRIVSVRESTGRLQVKLEAAIAGDGMNQVRVRVFNPTSIHAHDLASQGAGAPPANALGLSVGLNSLEDAGAAIIHTVPGGGATGEPYTPGVPGTECLGVDLRLFTFQAEVRGF